MHNSHFIKAIYMALIKCELLVYFQLTAAISSDAFISIFIVIEAVCTFTGILFAFLRACLLLACEVFAIFFAIQVAP